MTKKIKNDDFFDNQMLDTYEQEIEDAIDPNMKPTFISKKERKFFAEMAARHRKLRASQRINIRINNQDLVDVKTRAKLNDLPYQTLLSSLIHKFAQGEVNISI